ncbi:MAG: serine/threonine-protein phosphatase [Oscillospiraceae bacterium]|nr:serine/threonine-protein phosphatase [Oscillospiraceae bacterium]
MKKKQRSIKGKMTIAIVVMGILLSLCVGIGVFTISYRQVSAQYTQRAFSAAKAAALLVNGDSISVFLNNGKNEEYDYIYDALKEAKKAFGMTYLYVMAPDNENVPVYVFDIFTEGNDPSMIGELGAKMPDSDAAAFERAAEAYYEGRVIENTVVSITGYGWLASAYVPIYASDGLAAAVMGADISMNRIMGDIILQTLQVLMIILIIIAIFLFILRYIAGKQILDPVLAERERIATELNVATEIQASMLPNIFPAFPERNDFDIYAVMHPAKEVGGDFYDFFLINKDTLAVVIADVSDKGIPAALFMVVSKTLIKNAAMDGKSPKDVFDSVNLQLCENNDADMFVTAFMGYIDIPTGRLTYVNAGHNPPLIRRGDEYEFLRVDSGLMLAVMEDMRYTQEEVILNKGDMLFLYTDGVTEAKNKEKKLFTDKRMLEKANSYKSDNAKELLFNIKKEIDNFAEGAEQADDITMLALEIKPL